MIIRELEAEKMGLHERMSKTNGIGKAKLIMPSLSREAYLSASLNSAQVRGKWVEKSTFQIRLVKNSEYLPMM
jgi:hypothetical protein